MTRARSVVTYLVGGVVLALLLNVCMGAWSLSRPVATGSPTPDVGFATPTGVPTPSPSPIPPGVDGLRIYPLGTLPASQRLLLLGDPGDERVLFLDLAKGTVQQAAHFESFGTLGSGRQAEMSVTGDGSTVVILLWSDAPRGRLLVLHPSSGELKAFDIPASQAPRVSGDGRTVAVTRLDAAQRGVWLMSTADATATRAVEDTGARTTSRPIGWAADGRHLAIALDPNSPDHPQIGLVTVGEPDVRVVGPGRLARWRGTELLFWSEKPGTGVAVYDTGSGNTHPAFDVDAVTAILSLDVRSGANDIAVEQYGGTRPAQIVVHNGGSESVILADAATALSFWYSRDGAHLYVWTDDHGTSTVRDLVGGGIVLQFCLRGGVTPPCPAR